MIGIGYVILGILTFFLPGFFLSVLIYPGSDRLGLLERIGTSVGLGSLVVILLAVILAQPGIAALRLVPFLGSILVFTGVCAVLSLLRGESRRALKSFVDSCRFR